MMDRRRFLLTALAGALAAPLATQAQQATKMYRVGILSTATESNSRTQNLIQGLRELGYVEGQHFTMEYRRAAGRVDRLPELAADLVRANVDVIVAAGAEPAVAAKQATKLIPIVFIAGMPVERGLVASLARPGANVTGITQSVGLGKHLQLLKEAAPKITGIAYFYMPIPAETEYRATFIAGLEAQARVLGVKVESFPVRDSVEMERALSQMTSTGTNGLLIDNWGVLVRMSQRLCAFASNKRLPAIGRGREFADAGCLMSYGENLNEIYRSAATYVDRILKGTKPSDLPVEQAEKLQLVVNLKTAKALGLTIPPSLLARADQVIE
jgi:putative ABC transport system substrate-binding protein